MPISEAEWQEEIQKALGTSSDDGVTASELAEAMKVSLKTAHVRLNAVAKAGRLGVGWRRTTSKTGMPGRTPVYWIRKGRKK